jgi:hypothetical protein
LYRKDDPGLLRELLDLADQAKQPAWWQEYKEVDPTYRTLVGLEAEAVSIRQYESTLVPGLLQIPDYAGSVTRAVQPDLDPREVERRVEMRQGRQEVLTGPNPPKVWIVLDEAVVRRLVGGTAVLHEQIRRIVEWADLPNITVQVVPFDAGAHGAVDGSFEILEFSQREVLDVVYIEGMTGGLYLDRDENVARYRNAFDHLRAIADSPAGSIARLTRVADDLRD